MDEAKGTPGCLGHLRGTGSPSPDPVRCASTRPPLSDQRLALRCPQQFYYKEKQESHLVAAAPASMALSTCQRDLSPYAHL